MASYQSIQPPTSHALLDMIVAQQIMTTLPTIQNGTIGGIIAFIILFMFEEIKALIKITLIYIQLWLRNGGLKHVYNWVILRFDKLFGSSFANKHRIYSLSIRRKLTQFDKPNPEYDAWVKAMENVKDNNLSVLTMIGSRPKPFISSDINTSDVVIQQMNPFYKDFTTLYLDDLCKNRLISSLNVFRNSKHLLTNFGLSNKYGLFLSGPPGTGKTSTIYAVATYLQKPIYFVNLIPEGGTTQSSLRNSEVQMIFDYVNCNTPEGGIIVLEDIDCTTDIVLRHDSDSSTISSVNTTADAPLSLTYLLNLLDGILTKDGSIVVATSNHPDLLDPALMRPGRFDLHLELEAATRSQIQMIYNKFFSRNIPEDMLKRIPERTYTPAQIIFKFKEYLHDATFIDADILQSFMQ